MLQHNTRRVSLVHPWITPAGSSAAPDCTLRLNSLSSSSSRQGSCCSSGHQLNGLLTDKLVKCWPYRESHFVTVSVCHCKPWVADVQSKPNCRASVAATAAACILLLTKQQLVSRSLSGTCCSTSLRTSSVKDVRLGMVQDGLSHRSAGSKQGQLES